MEIKITQLPKKLFEKQAFFIDCTLSSNRKSIQFRALIDTGANGYAFLNTKCARVLCEALDIEPQQLAKPKGVKAFNGKKATRITHGVYPHMTIDGHSELTAPLLLTDLGAHDIILGYPWMKKHGVSVDCLNDRLVFRPNHCIHSFLQPPKEDHPQEPPQEQAVEADLPSSNVEGEVKLGRLDSSENVANPQRERGVKVIRQRKENQRKKDQMKTKKKKRKAADEEPEVVNICGIGAASFLFNTSKKQGGNIFSTSIKELDELIAWRERNPDQDITIFNINAEAEQYDDETLRDLIPDWCSEVLGAFKKKKLEDLPPHQPYDHKIELESPATSLSNCPLYNMSPFKLKKVKEYLEENLAKGFIVPSSAQYASPVLFVAKSDGGLRFCVDYRKLNSLSKKNPYPIPLIQEIMAQLAGKKYFSRFDIVSAFNNLRMNPDSEEYTTFKTTFGLYMYKVLPFGLTGGPGTWQRYMNDVLFDFLGKFCSVYLDDILVYSDTEKEHKEQVKAVLTRLQSVGLQVDIKKSEFMVQETKFLGVIVGVNGLRMDPEKIAAIVNWATPTSVKQILSFLGFCNFYRRFIRDFAKIANPMTALTKKNCIWEWTEACQNAFEQLKVQVTSAPVLLHFDPVKPAYLETDSSDYVTGGVLSQEDEEGVLHPVAFYSHKMIPAECNYEIYDKELLAIVKAFENWRPELEGSSVPVKILTDHRGLEYFQTKRTLTRRQARWAEKLSEFNFMITYRDGKSNVKADALTRQAGSIPTDPEDERLKYQNRALLNPEQFTVAPAEIEVAGDPDDQTIHDKVKIETGRNEEAQKIMQAIRKKDQKVKTARGRIRLDNARVEDDLIWFKDRIWVPDPCVVDVIKEVHSQLATGYPGQRKTSTITSRTFTWKGMTGDINKFITNCHTCRRGKAPRDKKFGLLEPLSIPQQRWKDIAMDFVTGLPLAHGNNAILTVTCRLSKDRHFIACKAGDLRTSSDATARMLVRHVWKHHGFPNTMVSDRGTQFVSSVWDRLCQILGVKRKLSTAYHPETDGQSENTNQWIEQFLRMFINYDQKNWDELLPIAEWAARANEHDTIGISPFFLNNGYHPRMSFTYEPRKAKDARQRKEFKQAESIAHWMDATLEVAKKNMKAAQESMIAQANKKRQDVTFEVGESVWLSSKNLYTDRPYKKLDDKMLGPFKIVNKRGSSCELELPNTINVHPVFPVNLLRKDPNDPLPGQYNEPPPPVMIEGEPEYEVEEILASASGGQQVISRTPRSFYAHSMLGFLMRLDQP